MKHWKTFFIIILALFVAGCSTLAGKKEDTGVVIARRAQVRS